MLSYNTAIEAPVGGRVDKSKREFAGLVPWSISEEVTIATGTAQKALSSPFPANFMPTEVRLTSTKVNALTTATSIAIGGDTSAGASVLADIAIGSLNTAGATVARRAQAAYAAPTTAFAAKLNATNGSGTVAGTANGAVTIKVSVFGYIIPQHDLT
jgi:hypothetical protein